MPRPWFRHCLQVAILASCAHGSLTSSDTATILAQINGARGAVSPSATNMFQLRYSATLATQAQSYADTMPKVDGDPNALNWIEVFLPFGKTLMDALNYFTAQKPLYDYSANTCNGWCWDYVQLVQSNLNLIGCGSSSGLFPDGQYHSYYVCYFDQRFSMVTPYSSGPSCSNCPSTLSYCSTNLCTSVAPKTTKKPSTKKPITKKQTTKKPTTKKPITKKPTTKKPTTKNPTTRKLTSKKLTLKKVLTTKRGSLRRITTSAIATNVAQTKGLTKATTRRTTEVPTNVQKTLVTVGGPTSSQRPSTLNATWRTSTKATGGNVLCPASPVHDYRSCISSPTWPLLTTGSRSIQSPDQLLDPNSPARFATVPDSPSFTFAFWVFPFNFGRPYCDSTLQTFDCGWDQIALDLWSERRQVQLSRLPVNIWTHVTVSVDTGYGAIFIFYNNGSGGSQWVTYASGVARRNDQFQFAGDASSDPLLCLAGAYYFNYRVQPADLQSCTNLQASTTADHISPTQLTTATKVIPVYFWVVLTVPTTLAMAILTAIVALRKRAGFTVER